MPVSSPQGSPIAVISQKDELPPIPPRVNALEHIACLRGGSQPHLVRCSDENYYVVKFINNPQGTKILANELLAHQLASCLKLPIPPCAIVDVSKQLIDLTEKLVIEKGSRRIPCRSGLAFGSLHSPNSWSLPPSSLSAPVQNMEDFWGMLVFDKWTCNTDRRQVLFAVKRKRFRLVMIDNGFCFNGGDWNFPDSPPRGLYSTPQVYQWHRGLTAFEPWLEQIEQRMSIEAMSVLARRIPSEWFGSNYEQLNLLLSNLNRRRLRTRELLQETINYVRKQIAVAPVGCATSDLGLKLAQAG